MIPKNGDRFSGQIMLEAMRMIPKGGDGFSDQGMRKARRMIATTRMRWGA